MSPRREPQPRRSRWRIPGFPASAEVSPVVSGTPGGTPAKKESKYKARIINKAPLGVGSLSGGASVEGFRPLTLTIEAKTKGEKADAAKLIKNVSIYGEDFLCAFRKRHPLGRVHFISLRVANISGSTVVNDCFTIIVTDKKCNPFFPKTQEKYAHHNETQNSYSPLFRPLRRSSCLGTEEGTDGGQAQYPTATEAVNAATPDQLIFVDLFATWCGPCKMMDKQVFPLKEVGGSRQRQLHHRPPRCR